MFISKHITSIYLICNHFELISMDPSFEISRKINFCEDLDSEFEFDTEQGNKRKSNDDVNYNSNKAFKPAKAVSRPVYKGEGSYGQRNQFLALDAYSRHKQLVNLYVLSYPGATAKLKRDTSNYKTDQDIIRENHKFLWEDDQDARTWGEQLAKKYYDRLFKEYCITDLSRYKECKIGMRWRTEKELVAGKGQFFCGSQHCDESENLKSWEVNFKYLEFGEKKNALVKLRLCTDCSVKLNHGYKGSKPLKEKLPSKGKSNESSKNSSDVPTSNSSANEEASEMQKHDQGNDGNEIWKQPIREEVRQSKEATFEEFLEDMLL